MYQKNRDAENKAFQKNKKSVSTVLKKRQEFGKMDSAKPSYHVSERIISITVTNER